MKSNPIDPEYIVQTRLLERVNQPQIVGELVGHGMAQADAERLVSYIADDNNAVLARGEGTTDLLAGLTLFAGSLLLIISFRIQGIRQLIKSVGLIYKGVVGRFQAAISWSERLMLLVKWFGVPVVVALIIWKYF